MEFGLTSKNIGTNECFRNVLAKPVECERTCISLYTP